MKLFNTVQ